MRWEYGPVTEAIRGDTVDESDTVDGRIELPVRCPNLTDAMEAIHCDSDKRKIEEPVLCPDVPWKRSTATATAPKRKNQTKRRPSFHRPG